MLNLNIDSLALTITNAEGHDHRIRSIVARAAAVLPERAEGHFLESRGLLGLRTWNSLPAGSVTVDLRTMSDEQIAQGIADALLQALTLKLI